MMAGGRLSRWPGPLLAMAWRGGARLSALEPCSSISTHVPPPYSPDVLDKAQIVRKKGLDLLHDPWYNKGTAFNQVERDALSLRGLLPPQEISFASQVDRIMSEYRQGIKELAPNDATVTNENIRKWKVLESLQNRNETLFYRILIDNFEEMAPIVYTPTVGWTCQNYHLAFRNPRGMFISEKDKGMMSTLVHNWPAEKVDAIVVTDGSRVLGLGDLGVNGLGICVGKLDVYCAGAGFHPSRVMPVVLDVGTNNYDLLNDPLYFGLRRPRIEGDEYYELIDEFMRAVLSRYPDVLVQFEDFSTVHAGALLERYRHHHLVFNDDIQGTATTVLGGVYGALAAQGLPPAALKDQRFVVVGSGSAGMGVVAHLAKAMEGHGLSEQQARERFWVSDIEGLVTEARASMLPDFVLPFARKEAELEGTDLLGTIRKAKPTILIGLSTVGGLFQQKHLEAMCEAVERPVVMPLSNPTSRLECTAEQCCLWTRGKAIYAAGSPQQPSSWEGRVVASSQANNMYIFPGLALGAHVGKTGVVTDRMLMAASEALPRFITKQELDRGQIFPSLANIREISVGIACAVIKAAHKDGHAKGRAAAILEEKGKDAMAEFIESRMFVPQYYPLVHMAAGKNHHD